MLKLWDLRLILEGLVSFKVERVRRGRGIPGVVLLWNGSMADALNAVAVLVIVYQSVRYKNIVIFCFFKSLKLNLRTQALNKGVLLVPPKMIKMYSDAGNRTPATSVRARYPDHWTTSEL
jgi:hypothetical protein